MVQQLVIDLDLSSNILKVFELMDCLSMKILVYEERLVNQVVLQVVAMVDVEQLG
jgi:hypothetical protein